MASRRVEKQRLQAERLEREQSEARAARRRQRFRLGAAALACGLRRRGVDVHALPPRAGRLKR